MKILHLSAVKSWGGGERHIENLCKELEVLSPEIQNTIFCVKNAYFHQRLLAGNFDIITSPMAFNMDPRYFINLTATCRLKKYDLLHIHDTTALALAIMADKTGDLPPFIFSKKTSFPIRPRKQTLYKYNYPKIKKILCVSNATLQTASENIENREKLVNIYHGTSLKDKCGNPPFDLRKQLHLSEDSVLIGNIANHSWPKNLEIFIKCADEIVNKWKKPNFHFVQMGTFTRLSPRLKKLLKKYKLQEKMTFMGYVPDAANFIPQFDISLMTSESEGVPQFIYESFYHEIPVVSTNAGGIPEVIKTGENGYLTEVGDYKKLADHLVTLAENCELRKSFGLKSKKLLHQKFTSEKMAAKTLHEYKIALNGKY